jgi:transcriptional regulator with XRE-family HTH domain
VSRSIIATLESYVRQPSLELIKRVSQKFKISVEYILDGSKKGKKKNKPETRIEIPEKQNTP